MISTTPEVDAILDGTTQGVMIPVLTITLRSGTVLRWALNKASVAFGGVTWLAHGQGGRPVILSYRWRTPVGLEEIGTCELVLGCNDTTMLGSERFQLAAAKGALKGAKLLVEEAYAAAPGGALVGKIFAWSGKIQSAPGDSHTVTVAAASPVADLKDIVLPRTLVSSACGNALYDTACGISRAAHTFTREVAAGATKTAVPLTVAGTDGEWDGGTLTFVTGALAGQSRGIRSHVGGVVVPAYPLPAAPVAGVSVTVTRGCDRTPGAGGCQKFANLARFRGMPHLPKE